MTLTGSVGVGKYIAENLFVSGIYIPQAAEDENDFEVALDCIVVRVGSDSLRLTPTGPDSP